VPDIPGPVGHLTDRGSFLEQSRPLLEISDFNGNPRANPAFNTSNPGWSGNIVHGKTFDGTSAHKFEWVSVLNPDIVQDDEVGLAGTAVYPHDSTFDMPFTHPFGNDFEFTIVPDPAYTGLLATANKDPNNKSYADARAAARASGISIPAGLLPVEIDGALVPPAYRIEQGDRVAVYGRWIVDAGHSDFHTEIHPPLVMARARPVDGNGNVTAPGPNATTLFQLWSRPYQARQLFTDGGHKDMPLQDYLTNIAETAGDIDAYPQIFATSFQGEHILIFTVRPPAQLSPAHGPVIVATQTPWLECSYHFTGNRACGIEIIPSSADPDSVEVILSLNSAGYPALPEPARLKQPLDMDHLVAEAEKDGVDIGWLANAWKDIKEAENWLLGTGGFYNHTFTPPQMPQGQDTVNTVPFTPLGELPRSSLATDNSQPFPVYGWLMLRWHTPSTQVATG
jgi:hypothetical protein